MGWSIVLVPVTVPPLLVYPLSGTSTVRLIVLGVGVLTVGYGLVEVTDTDGEFPFCTKTIPLLLSTLTEPFQLPKKKVGVLVC